jgi:hypothetical protein
MRNYLILAIIFLITASAIAVFYFTQPKATTAKLTGLEIAKMSYGFFDEMKRQNGWYTYSQTCKEETDYQGCEMDQESYPQTNAWVMLANLGLYDFTREQQYLNDASGEMDILLDNCKDPDNTDCLWVLVQMSELYKRTRDPYHLDKIKFFADKLLEDNTQEGVLMKGIEAREFAIVYGLTGNQKYLNESLNRLEKAKEYLKSEDVIYTTNGLQVKNFVCSAELAKLELYKTTKDERYLLEVRDFFDSAVVGSHGRDLYQLTAIQPCIESLLSLYLATNDAKYWSQTLNLTHYMITYRWDSPLNIAKKYNGDGGFLFETYQFNNSKTVTDTAYAIYLFSMMANTKFEIVSWR